ALDRARSLLAELSEPFTVSQARRTLGTTRRVAVPLLERLDAEGITTRLADTTRTLHHDPCSRRSHTDHRVRVDTRDSSVSMVCGLVTRGNAVPGSSSSPYE